MNDPIHDKKLSNTGSNSKNDEKFEIQRKLSLYDNTLKMVLDSIKKGDLKDGQDLQSLFVGMSNDFQVNKIIDDININKIQKLKINDDIAVSFEPLKYIGDFGIDEELPDNIVDINANTTPDEYIQQMIQIINQGKEELENKINSKSKTSSDRKYNQLLFDTINDNMEAAHDAANNRNNEQNTSNVPIVENEEKKQINEPEHEEDNDDTGICECDECKIYNINANKSNNDNDNANDFSVQFDNGSNTNSKKIINNNSNNNSNNNNNNNANNITNNKLVNLQNLFEDEIAAAIANFFENNKHLFPYFNNEQLKMLTENKPRVSVDAFTKHLNQYQKDRSKAIKDLTFADMADMASYVFEKEMKDRDVDVDFKFRLQHHQQQLEKHHQLQQEHQNLKLQHQYYKQKHQQLMDQCEMAKNDLTTNSNSNSNPNSRSNSNPKINSSVNVNSHADSNGNTHANKNSDISSNNQNTQRKTKKKLKKKKHHTGLQYINDNPTDEERKRLQRHCLQMLFMNDTNNDDQQHKQPQQKKKKNKKKKKNGVNTFNNEISTINHVGYNNPANTDWLCELCEYKIVYGEIPIFLTEWLQKKANNQEKMENYQRYLLAQRKELKREQLQRNNNYNDKHNFNHNHHNHHQNCEHDHENEHQYEHDHNHQHSHEHNHNHNHNHEHE